MKPSGSDLFLKQRIVAEIDHYRVKTPLEPAIEGFQVASLRPRRRHTVPAVELLLENLAGHAFEVFADHFWVLAFRKQIDRWLAPEILQNQVLARCICPRQPIQE